MLALGGRDGAIVVMDAQDGRLRAVVNEELAQTGAFPPGSAVKPFTLLAALRAGVVDANTRLLCRKHYKRGATEFTCSHPVYKTLFDPAHALAHSCNYFFAHLGERLDAKEFNATIQSFDFAAPPEARDTNAPHADAHTRATKRPPRAEWRTETALGEGGAILTTPLRMITAYAALVNGGHLFEPRRDASASFQARERARLTIKDEERAMIVAGMRGVVSYGTAERARLDAIPLRVFGKTGTATEIGGFRTHGWFVGFASGPRASSERDRLDASQFSARASDDQPAPAEVKLAVLVFLKRAQGKECAGVARPVFEEYARLTSGGSEDSSVVRSEASTSDAAGSSIGMLTENLDGVRDASTISYADSTELRGDATMVRVRLAREGEIVSMPLGDYLFGVLAAEASTEDEFNAIKSLAVVSRTYALQKLGRHAREGFDFCTTTHCERFLRVTSANARPDFHALLRRAVAETENEVLRDSRGRLANAYFSASCGGMTADVHALWGEPAREPFERGVADEYCVALPSTRWTNAIPTHDLLNALRADPRSDVGSHLDSISVVKRDATGRAELVSVEGERRRLLRGWDFKIIVGRTLGWSVVKSSRFAVERAGATFIFRGTGFGHGLGLCQAGAHVMARNGSSYLQILAHYFPGASVGQLSDTRRSHDAQQPAPRWRADATAPLHHSLARECHFHPTGCHSFVRERYSLAREYDSTERQRHSFVMESPSFARDSHSFVIESHSFVMESHSLMWESHSLVREWRSLVRESYSFGRGYDSFARGHYSSVEERGDPVRGWRSLATFRRLVSPLRYSASKLTSSHSKVSPARARLSSEHFRVSYPAREARRSAESILRTLEDARADLAHRLDAASLPQPSLPVLEINVNETTADFVAATGQPSWVAAATRGSRIELQPIAALERRGAIRETLRHEYAHAVVDALSRRRAPLWLAEGLAAHFAGEGAMLARYAPAEKIPVEEIERRLAAHAAPEEMRALYAASYAEVHALVRTEGEPRVWRRVAGV
ncbi:MAG: stage sporulation protein [Acidobacteriota bacterium]|nr:stage sporulation protein [Acidobacteriota bacterium]